MADSYYDREPITHIDGTLMFSTREDAAVEQEVAEVVAQVLRCEVRRFGRLAPIDWWAGRNGRLVGLLELKARAHPSSQYPTVYLNVRKWLALTLGSTGLGVPSLFVVRFTDAIKFIAIGEVDASSHSIAGVGRPRSRQSDSDTEPIIEVPIPSMKDLR